MPAPFSRLSGPVAAAVVALLVAAVAGGAWWWRRSDLPRLCPVEENARVTLSGLEGEQYAPKSLVAGTVLDLRSARWQGRVRYPLALDGSPGVCVVGGSIEGTWPRSTSWAAMHRVGGLQIHNAEALVLNFRARNYADALSFGQGAQDFDVRGLYVTYNRDDCVENDWHYTGTVSDSLLDGCYNAFSSRSYPGQVGRRDGRRDVWTIEKSLVRLQPMHGVYENRPPVPGHAGFFKWDSAGPRLVLRDNVFRADQQSSTVGLGLPPGKLAGCSGNVMVWLGPGRYPAPLPRCFRVARGRAVWDEAVADWKGRHGYGS